LLFLYLLVSAYELPDVIASPPPGSLQTGDKRSGGRKPDKAIKSADSNTGRYLSGENSLRAKNGTNGPVPSVAWLEN